MPWLHQPDPSGQTSGNTDVSSDRIWPAAGTCLYISPEQARGPNVDGRTDIYALGVIAYELVLGRHPFPEARTSVAAIAAHLTEPPPQPRTIWPGIPAALDLLLFSMVAKDPNYRPTLPQVRNVVASVRSSVAARASRAATVSARSGAFYSRVWTVALVAFALFVGIVIGMSIVGSASGHSAQQKSPVEDGDARRGGGRGSQTTTSDAGTIRESELQEAIDEYDRAIATWLPEESEAAPDAVTARGNPTSIERTPSVKPRPVPPPQGMLASRGSEGMLSLDSKPWTEVLVDGERKGPTPVPGLRLPAGRHKITLINSTYSIKESFRVEIKAGRIERIVKDYSDRPEVHRIDARTTIDPFTK